MASRANPTLKDLFLDRPEDVGRTGLGNAEKEPKIVELRSNLQEELPAVPWTAVSEEIGGKIEEVLDMPLAEILVSAWKKLSDFQQYRDRERYPPDEVVLVPLAKHTVKSSHKPFVEILVREQAVGRLDLDIQLAVELEGVVLQIQDGSIRGIRAGSWRGSGTLDVLFGGESIFQRRAETDKHELEGRLALEPPIEIPEL